jgi:hypothetical protein
MVSMKNDEKASPSTARAWASLVMDCRLAPALCRHCGAAGGG